MMSSGCRPCGSSSEILTRFLRSLKFAASRIAGAIPELDKHSSVNYEQRSLSVGHQIPTCGLCWPEPDRSV